MGFNDLGTRRIPRPLPSPRRALTIVAVYALAIGFGVALFTGNIPGLGGHITTNVKLYGHEYSTDEYYLPAPQPGNTSTSPTAVPFHNVTFWIWVTGWDSPFGTYVHINGTESNGSSYAFVLGGLNSNQSRVTLYVSPDAMFAAAWSGEFFVELLVEILPVAGAAPAGR